MMRESKTKVIGGEEYQVTQMGAVKGSQVFVRLVKVLGPLMGDNLEAALSALKEEDVTYLINAFQPYTMIQGKGDLSGFFDVHFAGKYKEMLEWLFFSVEVNFGSFLGANGLAALAGTAAKGVSQSTSQKVPIGPSGDSS